MKAPLCKLCQAEHWSNQPHAGMAAKRVSIKEVERAAANAGKKKAKKRK